MNKTEALETANHALSYIIMMARGMPQDAIEKAEEAREIIWEMLQELEKK